MDKQANGEKIKLLKCGHCGYETNKMKYSDRCDREDYTTARVEVTLGRYGVNGNGFNYWCPKDGYRMNIVDNQYNALKAFFGTN